MKAYKNILLLMMVLLSGTACNEDEFLEEQVLDFFEPTATYVTEEGFSNAVTELYKETYDIINFGGGDSKFYFFYSDVANNAISETHNRSHPSEGLLPETESISDLWTNCFAMITRANAIISRIDGEDTEFSSEQVRTQLKAEATFFRAWAYRTMVYVWGGVPLVLEEVDAPKRDFTRASKEEVLQQMIVDFDFASKNLLSIDEVPSDQEGRVTKAVAYHYLAETYLSAGDYASSVTAASAVIDGGSYRLMTERFGNRADEPADVYWDLFRRDNQNRSSGNMETLWAAQYELDGVSHNAGAQGGGLFWMSWFTLPEYRLLQDPDGVNLFTDNLRDLGGWAIGWLRPSNYVSFDIWTDPNDIRNGEHNVYYDIVSNNPESRFFGQKINESGAAAFDNDDYLERVWYPMFMKLAAIGTDFPDRFVTNQETGEVDLNGRNNFTDWYLVRLAETYLIRAEAYMMNGDQANAAIDINTVRNRAGAADAAPGDIDLEYILDERARELAFEELRMVTLMRTGTFVERMREFNPNGGPFTFDHHNLWPIPQSEIERNTEAVLEQNPGYTGG